MHWLEDYASVAGCYAEAMRNVGHGRPQTFWSMLLTINIIINGFGVYVNILKRYIKLAG